MKVWDLIKKYGTGTILGGVTGFNSPIIKRGYSHSVVDDKDSKFKDKIYNIDWTKDYKNLSYLLGIKGLNKASNNKIKNLNYLVFSLTMNDRLVKYTREGQNTLELIYSLRLVLWDYNRDYKGKKTLYEVILQNLEDNSGLIKEGGTMDIYYVSSNLVEGIPEAFRFSSKNQYSKGLNISLQREITLKKNMTKEKLTVNFYFFTFDTFFKEFLINVNVPRFNRTYSNTKLWGYPFLIIEDLNLPTVTYLLKEAGINASGMSHTRRHKLSPLEENLSNFLYVTDLNVSVEEANLCYSDSVFSNNKMDLDLYREIYKIQNYKYNKFNYLLKLKEEIQSNNIIENNPKLDKTIRSIDTKIDKLNRESMPPLVFILILKNYIEELQNNLAEHKERHIKLLSTEKTLNNEILDFNKKIEIKDIVIKESSQKLDNLVLEIQEINNILNKITLEAENQKLITQNQKAIRKEEVKKVKSIKRKKKIRKKFMSDTKDLLIKNRERQKVSRLFEIKKVAIDKERKELKDIENEKLKFFNLKKEKENMILKLPLDLSGKKIESIESDLKFKKDIKFSDSLTRTFNNRSKKFKSGNLIGKRKFSTINGSDKTFTILYNPLYLELKRLISNSPLTESTQKAIENYLILNSNEEAQIKNAQNLKINYNRLNPLVLSLLKNHVEEIMNLIDNYKFNLNFIDNMKCKSLTNSQKVESIILLNLDTEILLSLLLGRLIRIISQKDISDKNNCTQLAKDLGEALLWEYFYLEHLKFKNDKENKHLKDSLNKDNFESLSAFINNNVKLLKLKKLASDEYLIQMGLRLFNFLEEAKLIKTMVEQIDKTHKIHVYVPSSNISDKIFNALDSLNLSSKLPMITTPKKYFWNKETNKEVLGGYLLNDVRYIEPLIISRNDMAGSSSFTEYNKVFKLVNTLNSTGFKINNKVLNFILNYGLKFNILSDFYNLHPLEIKKNNLKYNEKLSTIEKKTLDSYLSTKFLEKNILGLALVFQNVNEFFIPVRIDNRGRVYCMAEYLNYQSIDLAKALLLFSKEEKIYLADTNSLAYLKIYGANCYGNGWDKKSFNERVKWVDDNEEDIINFYNGTLINKAENKAIFIAFCFEYQKYFNSKKSEKSFFYTNFPIKFDATCNGFQHISLILGDLKMAEKVNLTFPTTFDQIPNDLYYYIAVKVKENLDKLIEGDLKEKKDKNFNNSLNWGKGEIKRDKIINSARRLLKLQVSRKLIKTAVMVKPYNASIESRADYLKEHFKIFVEDKKQKYVNEDGLELLIYDFTVYSTIIDKVISNEYPKLKEFNDYLNQIGSICSKLNIPIIWTVPAGLIVKQKYMKIESFNLKPFKFSKTAFSLSKKLDTVNIFKQKRSLMPNLVHSLDASSLCLLVDSFQNIHNDQDTVIHKFNFYAIHDCFATTYNKFDDLISLLKAVYIKTYTQESFLISFDRGIIDYIRLVFGQEAYNEKLKMITVVIDEQEIKLKFPDVNEVIVGKIAAAAIDSGLGGIS